MDAIKAALPGNNKGVKSLPLLQLLPLTLAGFVAIMTETMPAGLLPQISASLHIKASLAGQLITSYALGSLLAAIPIITATLHWNRKVLLLTAITGFIIFNAITAVSHYYLLTLAARFLAGMGGGITWSLLIGYTQKITPPGQHGRAIALVGVGQPIALAIGVPIAAWLGRILGPAGTFGLMSILSLLLGVWTMRCLPGVPGAPRQMQLSLSQVLQIDGIKHTLFITLIWITAHNVLYTYIAPFLTFFGMPGQVELVLFVFGMASLVGIIIIGILIDKWLQVLIRISLLIFAIGGAVLLIGKLSSFLVYTGIGFWGLALGGIATLLQKSLADDAETHADVAQSMLVTVFNLAIAVGGVLGGILLDRSGAQSFPLVVLTATVIIFYSLIKRSARIKTNNANC